MKRRHQLCHQKKKKTAQQSWKSSYSQDNLEIVKSSKGNQYAFCKACESHFSVAHGGANDVSRHVASSKHQGNKKSLKAQPAITGFVKKEDSVSDDNMITRAEAMMCSLIVQHNLPFATADSLQSAVKEMFPDSKIAKGMKCCRNKATDMVKEMSAIHMSDLASRMKKSPFSLSTDGSQDTEEQRYPILVRIEGPDGTVNSELLAVRNCKFSSTGENIFDLVDLELKVNEIPWTNCLSFGSDNAYVMTGKNKGVISFVRAQHANVHMAGCCIHLVHISAKKGAACLPALEDVLVDIFHYFKKSAKRQREFRELQDLYDVEQRKMLKHVCTRWLSIKRCLDRLLKNWQPLRQFFQEEKERLEKMAQKTSSYTKGKVVSVSEFLKSPTNRLFCIFLAYTVKVFDKVLLGLQAEDPQIHKLLTIMEDLLRSLYARFVKPTAVAGKAIHDVAYKVRANQKEDEDLLVGAEARAFLQDPKKHHLRESRIQDFYSAVRRYFETVVDYLLKKLPFSDEVLQHARVVDPDLRRDVKFRDLSFFLERYPVFQPATSTSDDLTEAFSEYQQLAEVACCDRVDHVWSQLGQKYPYLRDLSSVMKGVMTIPHSSAPCERTFSVVRKNATEDRKSMQEDTLESLLVLKAKPAAFSDTCKNFTKDQLAKLKSAHYTAVQARKRQAAAAKKAAGKQ